MRLGAIVSLAGFSWNLVVIDAADEYDYDDSTGLPPLISGLAFPNLPRGACVPDKGLCGRHGKMRADCCDDLECRIEPSEDTMRCGTPSIPTTCKEMGCRPARDDSICQCDSKCQRHGTCCRDFLEVCKPPPAVVQKPVVKTHVGRTAFRWGWDPKWCLSTYKGWYGKGVKLRLAECDPDWTSGRQAFTQYLTTDHTDGLIRLRRDESLCVTVEGNRFRNGQQLVLAECNPDSAEQKWVWSSWSMYGNNEHSGTLSPQVATDMCLVIDWNNPWQGAVLQIWSCDGCAEFKTWVAVEGDGSSSVSRSRSQRSRTASRHCQPGTGRWRRTSAGTPAAPSGTLLTGNAVTGNMLV
eukprot:TRINITY_DN27064_c0_g2_i1.p1 TRINITY_DN27064_c0_g2~~TRINITY_DN27064_c0_g2_i1.p1  ORF type:complete len:352 (-),score=22.32 TRINITY_DN27064_c0_g2_i1:477-1532(-)